MHVKPVLLPKPSFPFENKTLEFVVPHLKVPAGPPGILRLCCNRVKSTSPCKFLTETCLAPLIRGGFIGLLEELQNQGAFQLFQPFLQGCGGRALAVSPELTWTVPCLMWACVLLNLVADLGFF